MADERSPILPTPATAHPRRRAVVLVVGAVTLVALAIAVLTLAFQTHSPSSSPSSTATTVGSPSAPLSETFTPTVAFPADALGHRELLPFCDERFITQRLNQFVADGGGATFQQRYFVCGQKQFFNTTKNGAIFLYTGNEGDVLLYLNNTGLMWENAEEFHALLVFAEHRYFGKSVPFGSDAAAAEHMEFLGSAQALADYAELVQHLKQELEADVPVIAFGGSYGGMLAAWFRLKYPHLVDGAIAGSAPLLHFVDDPDHPVDTEAFQRIVTFDMSPAAGASANCAPNVRRAFAVLLQLGATPEGRQRIAQELRLCNPERLETPEGFDALVAAAADVFGNLAMGNYPYPTSYIMGGAVNLPAYPMRAACEHLAPDFDEDSALLAAFREAVGVYFNATRDATCLFDQSAIDVDLKNLGEYIKCWELYMPVSSDGVHDVFPRQDANFSVDDARCVATWGIHLRPTWPETQYGGRKALAQASNIIFSNGNYDPWSGTSVLTNLSESVVAVVIDGGAHHVDLFFRNALDPPSLTQARETEKHHMRQWIDAFYAHKATRDSSAT